MTELRIDVAAARKVADTLDGTQFPWAEAAATCLRACIDEVERLAGEVDARHLHVECGHCGATVRGVVCADCGTRVIHGNGHDPYDPRT